MGTDKEFAPVKDRGIWWANTHLRRSWGLNKATIVGYVPVDRGTALSKKTTRLPGVWYCDSTLKRYCVERKG